MSSVSNTRATEPIGIGHAMGILQKQAGSKKEGKLHQQFADQQAFEPQWRIAHERIVERRHIKLVHVFQDGWVKVGEDALAVYRASKDNVRTEESQ